MTPRGGRRDGSGRKRVLKYPVRASFTLEREELEWLGPKAKRSERVRELIAAAREEARDEARWMMLGADGEDRA